MQLPLNNLMPADEFRGNLEAMFAELFGGGVPARPDFVFQQNTPIIAWVVNHSLGVYPVVTIMDLAGYEVEADVQYVSLNQIIVSFTSPASGRVRCV
jgi:hypothetical protein